MKGDFSKWAFEPTDNYNGVLHQQGRVLLDADWNADQQIDAFLRQTLGQDVIGAGVMAVPASEFASFRVAQAKVAAGGISVTLEPGRGWVDGILVYTPSPSTDLPATYLPPPFNPATVSSADIADSVRDAVVLEVWEEAVSGFQDGELLEPALGGPDTTERVRSCYALRLLRLNGEEDCSAVAARGQDDLSTLGKLSVTPAPSLIIAGDCPLESGGGYTGFEHYLYRIEIAQPKGGQARFKWSQFNGGLVGRGKFDSVAKTVTIDANNQAINHSGLSSFYLEALSKNKLGCWELTYAATATLTQDDVLSVADDWGTFPAAGVSTFFRLWNGIALVTDFPTGLPDPKELKDGLRLAFDAPAADLTNYRPGDYWTFPVRAAGVPLDTSTWPNNSPPEGIIYHRVPLAEIDWQVDQTASYADGEIEDCRHVFQALTGKECCCSYSVGDGKTTHGDFDSIAEAITHLPKAGGQICLLPGVHEAGVVIANRFNVTIHGCGLRTKVVPAANRANDPLFRVLDSQEITFEAMDMATLGGTAIHVLASKPGATQRVEVRYNRILACEIGVRVENAAHVHIHHNRIRMLDKQGGGVAIYMQADDSLIERNEITVIPALTMPPIYVPGGGGTVTPTDPCARLEAVYEIKKSLAVYLNLIWQVLVPLLPKAPYQALSGIQLAAGCERVIVLENHIEGGAGNGISLGGLLEQTQPPSPTTPGDDPTVDTFRNVIQGHVVGPDGKPVSDVQLVFTHTSTGAALQDVSDADGSFAVQGAEGKYTVNVTSAGYAVDKVDAIRTESGVQWVITLKAVQTQPDNALAFLYDIRIVHNAIAGMGLCGIGLAPQPLRLSSNFTLAAAVVASPLQQFLAVYGNPVFGLLIEANRIRRCLRNPFDEGMRALSQRRGLGGVSLGLCEDLDIVDNQIEGNGLSHIDPVCGIYVGFGEELQITRNRVMDNGPLVATTDNTRLQTGVRGGVVVGLASATSLAGVITTQGQVQASGRPAARIHENLIDQPAGQALTIMAFGPVACSDNSFTAEVSGPRTFDLLAGAVLIYNLGGVQTAAAGTKLQTNAAASVSAAAPAQPAPAQPAAGGDAAGAAATRATLIRREYADFARPAASLRILPGGYTLFADNQSRTGTSNRSFTSHLIAALDDLGYQGNQSYNYRTGNILANAYLFAGTVRATGNRLSEAGAETLLSLYTLGARMNNTTFNQGDHCIIATDQNPTIAVVQVGNQVLHPSSLCASVNMISNVMFKARG